MKRKRRKKLAKLRAEFQEEFELSDEEVSLVREMGYPLEKLSEQLLSTDAGLPMGGRIRLIHQSWREKSEKRRAAIEAGELQPKPKRTKSKKKSAHDPEWAKAKKACRLNDEDIRMAKELGFKPRSLMKNVPSPNQQWKAPVKEWIRDLYEERERKMTSRVAKKKRAEDQSTKKNVTAPPAKAEVPRTEVESNDDPF